MEVFTEPRPLVQAWRSLRACVEDRVDSPRPRGARLAFAKPPACAESVSQECFCRQSATCPTGGRAIRTKSFGWKAPDVGVALSGERSFGLRPNLATAPFLGRQCGDRRAGSFHVVRSDQRRPFSFDMEFEPGQKVRFVALRPIERFACELVLSSVTAELKAVDVCTRTNSPSLLKIGPVEINTFSGVLSATLVTGTRASACSFQEPIRHITIVGQICARPVDLAVGRFIRLASDARHELDRARKTIADYDAQAQELDGNSRGSQRFE